LKIWIDILTPKQLLFSEPLIKKLRRKHNVLCTSRSYDEISKLAKIRNFDLVCVGKHGGSKKYGKLEASTNRIKKLSLLIDKFSPELVISFCSPEAARVSFGMGIRHIAFCDSPHASAVMKLTLPLIQKLLIPWIIPKREFSKYGIDIKNIIPYKAIDASVTIKRNVSQKNSLPFKNNHRKNILIRVEEEQAAYTQKSRKIIPIIKEIIDEFDQENIVILGRYSEQIKNLRKLFGKKAKILKMSYDGKYLLDHTDVFLGSGGTMTAESALLGVPTISYNAVPNIVEKYLVKNNLVKRETDPKKINKIIKKFLESADDNYRKRARKISNSMEDPIRKVVQIIRK
jgi:predicted glycosyltransferase